MNRNIPYGMITPVDLKISWFSSVFSSVFLSVFYRGNNWALPQEPNVWKWLELCMNCVCSGWVCGLREGGEAGLVGCSSHRQILRALRHSWDCKEKREEHFLPGLLPEHLLALRAISPEPPPAQGKKILHLCSNCPRNSTVILLCSFWNEMKWWFPCAQIRRYVYHDVIRLDQIDFSYVQVSYTNGWA